MQEQKESSIYIIIVSYNGIKWLPKCLESTYPYPVIIIDNCSTDGSKEYIRANFPEVVLLEQEENLGFGRANNIGISYALKNEADFVFLLNQDAYLEPGTVSNLLRVSEKHPEYGILSPIHLNGQGTKMEQVFTYYLKKDKTDKLLNDLVLNKEKKDIYNLEMVNAAAWLIPRKTIDKVGGFHPMFFLYGEDDNYCQRVLFHGLEIGICPTAFVSHDSGKSYHESNTEGSEAFYRRFLNQIKVKYANVNTEDYRELRSLGNTYFKAVIRNLLSFKFRSAGINWHKLNLVKDLDFTREIEKGRKANRNYLEK